MKTELRRRVFCVPGGNNEHRIYALFCRAVTWPDRLLNGNTDFIKVACKQNTVLTHRILGVSPARGLSDAH